MTVIRSALACLLACTMLSGTSAQRVQPWIPRVPARPAALPVLIPVTDATVRQVGNIYTETTLHGDPLFRRPLTVRAYSLDALLLRRVTDLKVRAERGDTISFLRWDGTAVRAALKDILGKGALLAYADAEQRSGNWPDATWQGQPLPSKTIGYYLVWPDDSPLAQDSQPWVWNLRSVVIRENQR